MIQEQKESLLMLIIAAIFLIIGYTVGYHIGKQDGLNHNVEYQIYQDMKKLFQE